MLSPGVTGRVALKFRLWCDLVSLDCFLMLRDQQARGKVTSLAGLRDLDCVEAEMFLRTKGKGRICLAPGHWGLCCPFLPILWIN